MTSRNFIYPTMMLTRENLDDRICIEGASQSYTWKDLLCRIEGYRLAFVASNHKRIAIYFDELIDSAARALGMLGRWLHCSSTCRHFSNYLRQTL